VIPLEADDAGAETEAAPEEPEPSGQARR
jgi:hypothetical protein